VFVATVDSADVRTKLGNAININLVDVASHDACAEAIQRSLAVMSTAGAIEALLNVGVSAVPLSTLSSLRERNVSTATSFRLGDSGGNGGSGGNDGSGGGSSTFHFNTVKDHPIGRLCGMR
jgi:hypothetical protein